MESRGEGLEKDFLRFLSIAIFAIYNWLSRCSTARGSSTVLSLVSLTLVKACKSFLFTEGTLKVENKEHLFDFVVTLYTYNTALLLAVTNSNTW